MTRIVKYFTLSLLTFFLCFAKSYAHQDCAKAYKIVPGDVLSGIALKHLGHPVWGKDGTLKQIEKCNQHIDDIHMIYPQGFISLPQTSASPQQTQQSASTHALLTQLVQQVAALQEQITQLQKQSQPTPPLQTVQSPKAELAQNQDRSKQKSNSTALKHRYNTHFGIYQNVLDSQDRGSGLNAQWISKTNMAAHGTYQFNIQSGFWLGLAGGIHFRNYHDQTNTNFTWNQTTQNLLRLSIVTDYEFSRLGIGLNFDYSDEEFIYENNNTISLIKEALYGPSLRLKFKWLDRKHWSSRIRTQGIYHFSGISDINAKGKLGYLAYLDLARSKVIKSIGAFCQIYYGQKNITNNQNDQNEEMAGLSCGLQSKKWF